MHLPANPTRVHRSGQGAGAADLDHVVNAAAIGQAQNLVLPVRVLAVVHPVGRPQRLRLRQLAVR